MRAFMKLSLQGSAEKVGHVAHRPIIRDHVENLELTDYLSDRTRYWLSDTYFEAIQMKCLSIQESGCLLTCVRAAPQLSVSASLPGKHAHVQLTLPTCTPSRAWRPIVGGDGPR